MAVVAELEARHRRACAGRLSCKPRWQVGHCVAPRAGPSLCQMRRRTGLLETTAMTLIYLLLKRRRLCE